MADYTAEQLREGVLITDELVGETNFNLSFPSSLSGSAYFTFETKRNVTGSYENVTPLAFGDKEVGASSLINISPKGGVNYTGYVWSAIVRDGGSSVNNVITWTPSTNVGVGTAYLRGTGGISVNVV
jgi:hypothetical protein